ncbi:hypothetical protein L9G74_10875 [Shewanella sp. C32]|uniref:SMODS-associated and fused to various effectors domain-containing protein n=1 Tax=Shewanella electrica TaxID=515560 RepID=A0ABT2FKU1_9GAMM|nr:hypothetical protein [Shewanella electrica]MCH1923727.1 hypothetical protein [Shewanella electrica]MCS4556946.1 hypothetical protein [Shewanella electrica]
MMSASSRERWSTKTITTITLLVSVVLIATSLLYTDKFADWKNIQISVACSILASNIIMFLTSEYMLRSQRRSEIIDRWGVEAIYRTRAEMNTATNISLLQCNETIEIVAFGLKSFREAKSEEIETLLQKGVSIKILTINPDSKILDFVDQREDLLTGSTKKSLEDLASWVAALKAKSKKFNIEIRFYDALPLDFYFKVDERVYVGPYLKGLSSQQTISYEFSRGEGYSYWSKYFSKLWEESK